MVNFKKAFVIFLIILCQAVFATFGGFLTLIISTNGKILPKTYLEERNLSGLDKTKAVIQLEDFYNSKIRDGSFNVKIDSVFEYRIKYSEIDANINYDETINNEFNVDIFKKITRITNSLFNDKKNSIQLVLYYNDGKLKQKLNELAQKVNKEPVNANIFINEGKVNKTGDVTGLKINIDNSIKKLENEISLKINGDILFDAKNNFEIEELLPMVTMKHLEGLDEIIAETSIDKVPLGYENSVKQASLAINAIWILPEAVNKDAVFSFNKYMQDQKNLKDNNNEGYNQVISTLYKSILKAGIKKEAIIRTPHIKIGEYFDPGLDAIYDGNNYDFKFKNSLDSKIMIFSYTKQDKIFIAVVGKKSENDVTYDLNVVSTQKVEPGVIYVENQDLKQGQKRIINQGLQGIKVNVVRNIYKKGVKVSEELLHQDEYKPLESVVQIGPNTKWENVGGK